MMSFSSQNKKSTRSRILRDPDDFFAERRAIGFAAAGFGVAAGVAAGFFALVFDFAATSSGRPRNADMFLVMERKNTGNCDI
jgi:hypothetical protein